MVICLVSEAVIYVLLPPPPPPPSLRIYECNKRCKCCSQMCTNRLVQHGLQVRLQLFKTQNKGWGIRCLDDVAKGSFVCIYAGEKTTRKLSGKMTDSERKNPFLSPIAR